MYYRVKDVSAGEKVTLITLINKFLGKKVFTEVKCIFAKIENLCP